MIRTRQKNRILKDLGSSWLVGQLRVGASVYCTYVPYLSISIFQCQFKQNKEKKKVTKLDFARRHGGDQRQRENERQVDDEPELVTRSYLLLHKTTSHCSRQRNDEYTVMHCVCLVDRVLNQLNSRLLKDPIFYSDGATTTSFLLVSFLCTCQNGPAFFF